jgi:hypothetical protein
MLTLQDLLRTRTAQPPLNKALYFDGVDDYVLVSNSVSLRLDNNISILSFVYSLLANASIFGFIIRQTEYCTHSFYIGSNSEYFAHTYYDGVAWPGYAYFTNIYGRWVHLASTFSFPVMRGYLDGSRVVTQTLSTLPQTNPQYNANVYIGGLETGYYLKGYMAQLLIYTRALSDSEVVWNYNNPNNPVKDGLVLWLDARACDASRGICYDLSGNNNHGIMYGAQVVTLPSPIRAGGGL